ncbi:MAG: hypothetical protein M3N43_08395 [Actinomycetota bacterium]|nr:hypothetical protein [Actinomycetota bacterium]
MTTFPVLRPPVHRVTKGACCYGSGPTPCGAKAKLYPAGWRCDDHSPGALRLFVETRGAAPAHRAHRSLIDHKGAS